MNEPEVEKPSGDTNKIRNYVALALVGVAAILLVAWLVSGDDDSSGGSSGEAEIVSVDELEDTVSGEAEPVYWAGEQQGTELELSQPGEGRAYVRYLTDGADAGDPSADFLTVATYPTADPVAALRRQAKEAGGVLGTTPGKGVVYFDRNQPNSVYLAYPGVDVQIEIFDPNFTRALQLVNSGQIVPVG